MTNQNNNHIIIAPHPDDEIIGCFDILNNPDNSIIVIYTEDIDKKRKEETKKIKEYFENIKGVLYLNQVPHHLLENNSTIHYPDPIFENHPVHRLQGNIGEQLIRFMDINVIFYSVNMSAPYIYENENSDLKLKALNEIYPSQKDLWEKDYKYFLFEGHCQWLMKNHWNKKEEIKKKENPNEVESEIIIRNNENKNEEN